ncbi:hypothetical protein HXY33_05630 [Candidatus Bathyarchaeota archaeon]|nr:hypothetical protein [Candidatus Bathyarchaeota archaeon]
MHKRLLILAIALLFTASIVGLLFFGFKGGGFGKGYGADNNIRSLSLILFIIPLILAVGIIGYAVAFPSIKTQKQQTTESSQILVAEKKESVLDAVLRFLDEDEKKVVKILADSGDKTMLQKDIRWKTGLSRVKTHRVLYRLAKRGLITVEKHYNTNMVKLAEWLTKES